MIVITHIHIKYDTKYKIPRIYFIKFKSNLFLIHIIIQNDHQN